MKFLSLVLAAHARSVTAAGWILAGLGLACMEAYLYFAADNEAHPTIEFWAASDMFLLLSIAAVVAGLLATRLPALARGRRYGKSRKRRMAYSVSKDRGPTLDSQVSRN